MHTEQTPLEKLIEAARAFKKFRPPGHFRLEPFYTPVSILLKALEEYENPLKVLEPELVPLEMSDVPPGSVIGVPGEWTSCVFVREDGITFITDRIIFRTWIELFEEKTLIDRRDGKGFVPCSKPKS